MNDPPSLALTIEDVDKDDALGDTRSRLRLARRVPPQSGTRSTAFLGMPALPEARAGASSNDVDILNYALVLEHLQAAFYTETE